MSPSIKNWPLQTRVSLTLVMLIAFFVVISYAVLRSVIAPAFGELEQAAARRDLHRAEAALESDIERLNAATADWAPWDDIYAYVGGESPGFQKSNLNASTLENLGVDLMAIFASNGDSVWKRLHVDGQEVPTDSLDIVNPASKARSQLISHDEPDGLTAGFVQTVHGPMIISSRPILRSDSSGPIAGAMIMGQFLTPAHLERLRHRTEVDMAWTTAGPRSVASSEASYETLKSSIIASKTLSDISGKAILELTTETPRNISSLGSRTIIVATLFMIVAGALVCAVIGMILSFTILRPIHKLTAHVDEIRSSGDLSRQLEVDRGDEIGMLGKQFNSMTADIEEARRAILEQSFKAGKADTAAEVMHNIRNAMTPMINGLERLYRSFNVADSLRVAEAVEQLGNDDCPPQRKQKFLEYVAASFQHIRSVSEDAKDELGVVMGQAKQVAGILSEQEKFANVAPLAEILTIDDVLHEAGNVLPKDSSQAVELTFEERAEALRVRAHRIGLLQVLGNLVLNAYESIKRNNTLEGRIVLAASNEIVDEKSMVRVVVRDNGSGFDGETREQIFQRGFTSKTQGETAGLGLHWCANAVASMGGRIFAESAGNGQGAEFHVLLPAAQGG